MQKTNKNIALVGMMACSKTTSGKALAQKLSMDFFDSDELYTEMFGESISDTFKTHGEEVFRCRETEVLFFLANKQNAIISCGGGIVLKRENRDILKQNFFVVELTCDCSEIYNRVKKDGDTRPLLSELSTQKIEGIYNARKSLYCECAAIKVDTTTSTIDEIADKIASSYSKNI